MEKTDRKRLHLAELETLHMTHVLKELDRDFFTDLNKRDSKRNSR